MKSILIALLAITAIFAVEENSYTASLQTCTYVSPNGDLYQFYGLGYLGDSNLGWLNGTDTKGNIWNFQVCQYYAINDEEENTYQPCPADSSVCITQVEDGQTVNRGSTATAMFSDLPSGGEGFEVMFGSSDDDEVKTVIDFVCSNTAYSPIIFSIQSDDKFTTITVNSSEACRQTEEVYLDGDYESTTVRIDGGFLFFALIFIVGSVCSLCCCCCLARRRRIQRNKDIAMKQFSNVAFQPIPSVNRTVTQQTSVHPLPSYNPYLVQQQPQFVYYYPHQQQQQVTPPIVPLQTVDNDEKIAKELQAQFDREAQV